MLKSHDLQNIILEYFTLNITMDSDVAAIQNDPFLKVTEVKSHVTIITCLK